MNASHVVKGFLIFIFTAIVIGCATNSKYDDISHIRPLNEIPIFIVEAQDLYSKKDLECMQANLYFEAGNQSNKGMAAVGYVTMNRVHTSDMSVCQVVKQKKKRKNGKYVCQFSWHCDNKSDTPSFTRVVKYKVKVDGKMVTRKKTIQLVKEREAWERAGRIAIEVMTKKIDNPIGSATMYHATYVKPGWDYHKLSDGYQVGTHIFYTLKA